MKVNLINNRQYNFRKSSAESNQSFKNSSLFSNNSLFALETLVKMVSSRKFQRNAAENEELLRLYDFMLGSEAFVGDLVKIAQNKGIRDLEIEVVLFPKLIKTMHTQIKNSLFAQYPELRKVDELSFETLHFPKASSLGVLTPSSASAFLKNKKLPDFLYLKPLTKDEVKEVRLACESMIDVYLKPVKVLKPNPSGN